MNDEKSLIFDLSPFPLYFEAREENSLVGRGEAKDRTLQGAEEQRRTEGGRAEKEVSSTLSFLPLREAARLETDVRR